MSSSQITQGFPFSGRRITVAIIVVALVLAGGIGAWLTLPSRTYDFSLNQKVSAASALRLSFPDEMDRSSVEQFLALPEGLMVEKEWSDNTLVLRPISKLETGRTYAVLVDGRALKRDGTPLGNDLRYTFIVSGAPAVTAQIPPANGVDVPVDARITIVFDRPVVPLTQVQGASADKKIANWPVTITPFVKGRWRWIGTTSVTFEPEKSLPLATKFTVQVPPGIVTVSGDATEKDFSWSFETERPRIMITDPGEGSRSAGPGARIAVTFSQDMDLISAKDGMKLTAKSRDGSMKNIPIASVKYGTIEENLKKVTDKATVELTPSTPLQFDTAYTLAVTPSVRGLVGNLGTATGFVLNFRSVGPFNVQQAGLVDGYLRFDFSSPVSEKKFNEMVISEPAITFDEDAMFSTYETGNYDGSTPVHRIELFPQLKPSTSYTISFKDTLKDIYGQKLEKPFRRTFTTPEVTPRVFIHPEGGWYQTMSFDIFERGKPPVFFMNDVNVSRLDVEFGRLSLRNFGEVRMQKIASGHTSVVDAKSVVEDYKTIQVKPKAKHDEWESMPFDLEKNFGKLQPGLYLLTLRAPEWKDNQGAAMQEERVFALTNMGLTLKYSRGKALVWVVDLQTGEPVSGVTVKFHTLKDEVKASGKTDKDGFFETPIALKDFKNQDYDWRPEFWVTAEKGDDFAFVGSDWNEGIAPYDFGQSISDDFRSPDSAKYRIASSLYTERPLYGGGDTVYFKGVVRLLDDNGKLAVPDSSRSVHVTVMDPSYTEVYAKDIKISEFGTFSDSLALAAEAPLGMYTLQATLTPDSDVEGSMYAGFSVLAYRKPEYRMTIATDREEYANGDTAKADFNGQYYFGAPMGGAPVNWRLVSTDYFFNKYTDGWYSFALEDSWCWDFCERGSAIVSEGQGTLDAAGGLSLSLPINIDDKGVSQLMTLEADVTDENNQVVSQRKEFIAHKSNLYVGIRSDDYGVATGQKASMHVVTLNTDGSPKPSSLVEVKLYSRTWNVTKQKGVDGEYYYESEPQDTFIRTVTVRLNDLGKAVASVQLDKAGEYRVIAVARDEKGRESKAGWSLYAWGDTYVNWPHTNNDRIDVIADKPEYKVGDTAKLIVKSPYQGKGVKALVTIERENVISRKIVDVVSNAQAVEVQITDDLVPVAYISVIIIKPRIGETFNENGLDTGAPAFKMGYARLKVDTSTKKLDISITTDKEKYLPGEKVSVSLTVKDSKGKPVQADLSLGVVDMSLLDLTGFQMPDVVGKFYYERGVGVATANMLVHLMERFKPGSKGGGGGEERKRGTFKDTAYWNPQIVTDKDGRATATFTLPDNLTTWHLLAIGSTKDTLVGGFAKTIIETKRVIVRPVRPRFEVAGDDVILGAIVHNFLEEDRDFTVSLRGKGFTLKGKAEQTVRVGKGEQVKLDFPVHVNPVETMTMTFLATTDGARDEIEESIPVYRFGVQQTNATANVTENRETENVTVPSKADAPDGSLSVTVAPTIAVYLPDGLQYLSTFPYGCAEQVTSSFVGSIALAQLKQFDQFRVMSTPDLEKNVQAGLQQLYQFQRVDGGFGYFQGSYQSYPSLTAYILHSLKLTKDAGYAVDAGVVERAQDYLASSLKDGRLSPYVDASTRAYGLFVLAELGSVDAAGLNAAYKERADLDLFSRGYLAMAFKKAATSQGEKRAKELLDELLGHARVDARGAHFEEEDNRSPWSMNTDDRTTAIVLQALVRIEPDNVLLPRIIRGMLASRRDGHWDTTQSTLQSVLAFVDYLKQSNELEYNEEVGVEIDGKKKLDATFKTPAMEMKEVVMALAELPRGKEIDVSVGKTGAGKLYYDLVLSYFYTPDVIKPAEEGIGILRESVPMSKADTVLKTGSTRKVTLTITVPETRHFVAVESMLPAGFEPIDLNLATSQQELYGEVDNRPQTWREFEKNQIWRFSHIEFRDDRIFLFADELPPGVYTYEYVVRATTPGTFHERPARVWEMYNPEVFGQTEGKRMTIGQ